MTLGTILLIVLILLLVGALPSWGYSRSWGYGPSGGLGLIVLILVGAAGSRTNLTPPAIPSRPAWCGPFFCAAVP